MLEAVKAMERFSPALKAKLVNLPDQPGVYLMKDAAGKILYVGKAKVLKHRVRSYFQSASGGPWDPKVQALVSKIADFEILATDNEMEALILEANLIKEHKPRYNVNLKDDKRYPYLKLTSEPFPRLLVVRRVKKDKARYFGPYTDVKNMRKTLKLIGRIFQIRSCNLPLPPPPGKKFRVCLEYFIKRCPGPCESKISQAAYQEMIDNAALFLEGKNVQLIKSLREKMEKYAAAEKFEQAALVRDQLLALESVVQKQKVVSQDEKDRDILAFARSSKDICAVALQVRDGRLLSRQQYYLTGDKSDTDAEILSTFVKQYYVSQSLIPDEIYLPASLEEEDLVRAWLEKKKGAKVAFVYPQRGEKAKLLEMAEQNAKLSLDELLLQKHRAEKKVPEAVTLLKKDLFLDVLPRRIVAFDISNLGTSDPVGSAVYFEDARPKKSEYRHFQIKTVVDQQDDFAMMREVVNRYFSRLIEEQRAFPDLVLIDGGKGQLSSALEALTDLNVTSQPIIGLAKRLEEVILSGAPESLTIPKSSPSLRLLQQIRDEAHRFAITYHRKKRTQRTIKSELDDIKGIGPARRQALLSQFGSVEQIKAADLEALKQVPGLGERAAQAVHEFFHPSVPVVAEQPIISKA